MSSRPTLSVVVPMRNEARNLARLFERLRPVLDTLDVASEVLCIDDGSSDDTLAVLKLARAADPRVKIVALSRNFGKETALAAGLRYATGDAVVLMDADLQHPPELIRDFLARWRDGFEMVYAQRRDRRADSAPRRWLSRAFYRVFSIVSQTELPEGAGDFRLLDRKIVDALNRMDERTRFTKGLYSWVGFNQVGLPYDVPEREHGASHWSLLRLWRFAIDGITAFSTLPLRVASYIGLLVSLVAIGYGALIVIETLLYGVDVPGYASLIVAILFLSGVQLVGMGIMGEYLGRIFEEVKRRPLFLVREEVGFSSHAEEVARSPDAGGDEVVGRPRGALDARGGQPELRLAAVGGARRHPPESADG